jgi:drug/metabolite transporter (DMT)-like permease
VLAAACWVQGRRHPLDGPKIRLTRRVVWLLVLQATVGVTGFNYCTAEAVRHTGAATVGTVIAAVPVVLAIAGPLAARRRPAPRVIAGALLVAAGVALPIRAYFRRGGHPANGTAERGTTERGRYGGGAAAKPDADGGTACLAHIARTGAPRGAAPPHSVTIQVC